MARGNNKSFITITNREIYGKLCNQEKKIDKIEQNFARLDNLHITLDKINGRISKNDDRLGALEKMREKALGAVLAIAALGTLTINWVGSFLHDLLK